MPTPAVNGPAEADPYKLPILTVTRSIRRRSRLHSEGLALTLLLTCGGTGVLLPQPSEGLDRGRTIYREHCMECHGPAGKGDGPKAPFLSPRPGNLISAATSAKTDTELLRTIAHGKPRTAMPAWKDTLPADDQQTVLFYIRSLIQFSRSPATHSPTTQTLQTEPLSSEKSRMIE